MGFYFQRTYKYNMRIPKIPHEKKGDKQYIHINVHTNNSVVNNVCEIFGATLKHANKQTNNKQENFAIWFQ